MTDERPVQHFPDTYSIKAVGRDEDQFANHVVAIVRDIVGADSPIEFRSRPSRNGAYVSLTLSFTADSQAQLDEVFRQVSADSRVVWVL